MAQKLIEDLKEDILKCSICMSQYKKPLALPCLHSFCSQCLEKYERSCNEQPFSCPTCRRLSDLPPTGVKNYPENFILTNLMEQLKKSSEQSQESQCIFCKDAGISFCLDCKIRLCQNCEQTHSGLSGSTDHTVISSEKLSDANYLQKVTATQSPQCKKHPQQKLRFYCETCNQLVCPDCAILSHQRHDCVEANIKIATAEERLRTILEKSENFVKDGLNYTKEIERAVKKLEDNRITVRNQIDSYYDKILKKLQSDKEKMYEELEKVIGQKRTPLQQKNLEHTNWMRAMKNPQEVTRRIVKEENPLEILKEERHLVKSLNTLGDPPPKNYDEIQNIVDATFHFKPANSTIYENLENASGSIQSILAVKNSVSYEQSDKRRSNCVTESESESESESSSQDNSQDKKKRRRKYF